MSVQTEKIKVQLKAYKLDELSRIYGVSKPTLRKKIGRLTQTIIRKGNFYTITQVQIIFNNLILPNNIEVEV